MLDPQTGGGALEPISPVFDLSKSPDPATPSPLLRGLEALYRAVMSGVAFIPGPSFSPPATPIERDRVIDSVIRHHALLAASLGFVTNVGGLITLPVAIPANLVGVTAIQLKMIQEIARLYGLDPVEPAVMSFALASLVGGKAVELVDGALAPLAGKAATRLLSHIPATAIAAINRSVGFRLVTRFGANGVVNIGRWIPIAGGVVCGSVDGGATYAVGRAAKKLFGRYAVDAQSK